MAKPYIYLLITLAFLLAVHNYAYHAIYAWYSIMNTCQSFVIMHFLQENSQCSETTNLISLLKTFGSNKPTKLISKTLSQSNGFYLSQNEWIVEDYYYGYLNNRNKTKHITNAELNVRVHNPFGDDLLEIMMGKYADSLRMEEKIAIISWFEMNYDPWIEAFLIRLGITSEITTIDLNKKSYENSKIKTRLLTDYNNVYNEDDKFDSMISYFSLETIGLGKYGEMISLDADIDVFNFIECKLRPRGRLYLTVSVEFGQQNSSLQFNTKRIYGKQRLEMMMHKKWNILDSLVDKHATSQIFVLEKIN